MCVYIYIYLSLYSLYKRLYATRAHTHTDIQHAKNKWKLENLHLNQTIRERKERETNKSIFFNLIFYLSSRPLHKSLYAAPAVIRHQGNGIMRYQVHQSWRPIQRLGQGWNIDFPAWRPEVLLSGDEITWEKEGKKCEGRRVWNGVYARTWMCVFACKVCICAI